MAKATISEKSKKSEVLDAYYDLLEELKKAPKKLPQEEKKIKEDKETVVRTSTLSFEEIVKSLSDVKLKIGKGLELLEEELLKQYKKFADLQKAIEITKQELEDIHHISVNANSLTALIEAQKKMKEEHEQEIDENWGEFNNEMDEKRKEWEKEKKKREQENKEQQEILLKDRQREEEGYQYDLELKRKKELDAYHEKKIALEKELEEIKSTQEKIFAEREKALQEREKQIDALTKEVDEFPKRLEKVTEDVSKKTTEEVKKQYEFQIRLSQQERIGEKKLLEQQLEAAHSKIKEQGSYIAQLTAKINESGQQVQSIALKAVEGASFARNFVEVSEGKNYSSQGKKAE
jgi:hypothetical protein